MAWLLTGVITMAGALSLELVDASTIALASSAYASCRKTLRMQVASKIGRAIPGADNDLVRAWDTSVADWYVQLSKGGASFLGDGAASSGTSQADGPTWHGSRLERDTVDKMSSTIPMLRKNDQL
jgi:hypothetical protein